MTKNYLCIMMLAALALFASCSDSKTSPEAIEGYEFTGDGISVSYTHLTLPTICSV